MTCQGTTTNCTSCPANYFLETNACIQACSDSYYSMNSSNICNNCNSSCLTCQGSATNCLSCPNITFFENNSCVQTCSDSNYAINLSNLCNNCNSSCLTCQGSAVNCTSCPNISFLENNSCIQACSAGYYSIDSSNICNNCNSSCLTCQGLATNCTACQGNRVLENNSCYTLNVSAELYKDYTESQTFVLVFQNFSDNFIGRFENYTSNSFQLNISLLTPANYSYNFTTVSQGVFKFSFLFNSSINDSNILSISFNSSFLSTPDVNLTTLSVSIPVGSDDNLTYITPNFEQTTDPLTLPFTFSSSFPELFSMMGNVLNVSISDFESNNYNFSIQNTSNPLTFNLLLSYNVSLIGVHTLNLDFDLPHEIFDINNHQLTTTSLTTSLLNYYILSEADQTSLASTKQSVSSVASPASASLNSFSLLNSGSSLLFSALVLMKFISFLKFLNINYPPNALAVLEAEFKLFSFIPSFSIDHINNPVDLKFAHYSIDNYVINNLGNSIVEKLVILLVAVNLNFIKGKCDKLLRKCKLIGWIFDEIYRIICWNFFLNSIISFLNDYFFFSLINIAFPTNDSIGVFNIVLSVLNILLSLSFLIFLFFKILKINRLLNFKQHKQEEVAESPSFADPSISRIVTSKRKVVPLNHQEFIKGKYIELNSPSKRTDNLVSHENTEIYSHSAGRATPITMKNSMTAAPVNVISLSKMPSMLETHEHTQHTIIEENDEKEEAELQKFEILHMDFKQHSKLVSAYFILDLFKFLILSLIIVFDRDHPFRQSIFILIITFSMILFLVVVRPYKSNYLFVINIISQICVLFCTCAAVVLANYDYIGKEDQESRFMVGKLFVSGTLGLVYLMTGMLIGHSLISAFRIIKFVSTFLRNHMKKNVVVPVIPLGSSIKEN